MKFTKVFGFEGGIHPPEEKTKTRGKKLVELGVPSKIIIPLLMSGGKISKPVVSRGIRVLKYQKIAEEDGNFSLPVHSPTSGTVEDINYYMHPILGEPVLSVLINPDGKDEPVELRKNTTEYFRQSPQELVKKIKEAGICGLGGAGFPTHIKLTPPGNREIKTVIINGCECEPILTNDEALLLEHSKEIIEGLKIVMHILSADTGIIAVEDNKKEAILRIEEMILTIPNIDVAVLRTKYPQGGEKQLVKSILNKEIASDCLPCEESVIILNVGTVFAIKKAVCDLIPLVERVITVTGDNISNPSNLKVKIGTPVEDILKFSGYDGKAIKIIMGGPMMGITLPNIFLPVVKGTTGLVTFSKERIKIKDNFDCIKCGRCISTCPVRLFPTMIYKLTHKGLFDDLRRENVLDCIECGSCSYICPSELHLAETIKYAKKILRSKKQG